MEQLHQEIRGNLLELYGILRQIHREQRDVLTERTVDQIIERAAHLMRQVYQRTDEAVKARKELCPDKDILYENRQIATTLYDNIWRAIISKGAQGRCARVYECNDAEVDCGTGPATGCDAQTQTVSHALKTTNERGRSAQTQTDLNMQDLQGMMNRIYLNDGSEVLVQTTVRPTCAVAPRARQTGPGEPTLEVLDRVYATRLEQGAVNMTAPPTEEELLEAYARIRENEERAQSPEQPALYQHFEQQHQRRLNLLAATNLWRQFTTNDNQAPSPTTASAPRSSPLTRSPPGPSRPPSPPTASAPCSPAPTWSLPGPSRAPSSTTASAPRAPPSTWPPPGPNSSPTQRTPPGWSSSKRPRPTERGQPSGGVGEFFCRICKRQGDHATHKCRRWHRTLIHERHRVIRGIDMCHNCFRSPHNGECGKPSGCRGSRDCLCQCGEPHRHNSLLCAEPPVPRRFE